MNPSEFWRGWTKRTGRLTWRIATPDDLPAIRRLSNASQRLTGEVQREPLLFSMPTLLTIVAENDCGKVVDCLFLEAQVELVKMGCSEDSLAELAGLEEDLSSWLRTIGIKTVLATTLVQRKDKMGASLRALGFRCADKLFSYWRKHL